MHDYINCPTLESQIILGCVESSWPCSVDLLQSLLLPLLSLFFWQSVDRNWLDHIFKVFYKITGLQLPDLHNIFWKWVIPKEWSIRQGWLGAMAVAGCAPFLPSVLMKRGKKVYCSLTASSFWVQMHQPALGRFCVEFACSASVCSDALGVLWLPSTILKHACWVDWGL